MADVVLDDVSRVQADGSTVVSHLTLHVRDRELLVLIGPSGSGKTTVLRMIAGLDPLSSGEIRFDGARVDTLPPHRRDVAMVFESNALYPHLTAGSNMRFGLELRKLPAEEIDKRVQAESRVLKLQRLLGRRPATLSAGERQRVAVGRATVRVPRVFLMDEPLGHLDAGERMRVRAEIAQLQRGLGVTTIYVTHDQEQAMAVGDRVAVLRAGVLEQVDTPRALYDRPVNLFVAGFFGEPPMRFVPAWLRGEPSGAWLELGTLRLPFPGSPSGPLRRFYGRALVLGLRSEHVQLDPATSAERPIDSPRPAAGPRPAGAAAPLPAVVTDVEYVGAELFVHCQLDAGPALGEDAVLTARCRHLRLRRGDRVGLVVDLRGLCCFDPATEALLWSFPAATPPVGA